jgi:hypothetical protein
MRLLEHQHARDAVRRVTVHHALYDVSSGSLRSGKHQLSEPIRVVQELWIAAVELEQQVLGECVHGSTNLRPSSATRAR